VCEVQLMLGQHIAPFDSDNSDYGITSDSSSYPIILDKLHQHLYIQLTVDAQLYLHICKIYLKNCEFNNYVP